MGWLTSVLSCILQCRSLQGGSSSRVASITVESSDTRSTWHFYIMCLWISEIVNLGHFYCITDKKHNVTSAQCNTLNISRNCDMPYIVILIMWHMQNVMYMVKPIHWWWCVKWLSRLCWYDVVEHNTRQSARHSTQSVTKACQSVPSLHCLWTNWHKTAQ